MKKLLITGFEPFGGESINPSWEAVQRLPEVIGPFELDKLRIPVVFGAGAELLLQKAEKTAPDIIISVGQAGGRNAVTPETAALNLCDARIPDNAGQKPLWQPAVPGGPDAIFATLPVRQMAQAISNAGVPSALSFSAGTYVCNDVMYRVLYRYRHTGVSCGFIHVPFLPEQAKEGQFSLPLHDIVKALTAAIRAIIPEEARIKQ